MTDNANNSGPLGAWTDIGAAIVLSISALLTSWAGFQAALWDGEQAAAYTRAGAARVEASLLATENGQFQGIDLFLFTQWLNAYAHGDRALQTFYRSRFRPEFARAFDAWVALKPLHDPKAPHTPFVMREYAPHLAKEAERMNAKADALFERGQHCNEVSDAFVGVTVLLALSLFLGGIGQTFERKRITTALTALATVVCVVAVIKLTSLPTLEI